MTEAGELDATGAVVVVGATVVVVEAAELVDWPDDVVARAAVLLVVEELAVEELDVEEVEELPVAELLEAGSVAVAVLADAASDV